MWLSIATVAAALTVGRAAAGPCEVTFIDDPLDGRVVELDNGLVEVRVAPQLGGRILALQRAGGERLIRYKADWDQTKEWLWSAQGSADLSDRPATAWTGTSEAGRGIVRWASSRELGDSSVQVTREIVVTADSSVAWFRVTIHNTGDTTIRGLGYSLRPHFFLDDDTILQADEAVLAAVLRDPATDLRPSVRELRAKDTTLHFGFPTITYRLRSQRYMFSLEHAFPIGDLAPGAEAAHEGAWVLTAPDQSHGDAPPIDWTGITADAPVEPLVVRDSPPEDLPRTPVAADSYFGLCGHGGKGYFPLWQAAGVQWIRAGFGWAAGEPRRGEYDFEAMDAVVDEAEESGVRLIGLIHGIPGWASRAGTTISPPTDLGEWESYVERLTERYQGRVEVWEIWNEPDIGQFWTGTVDDYVALLAAAYRGAKRGNPECLVMSAGLDGPGERFLMGMIDRGAMEHCDLVGFHPYAGTPAKAEERMRAVWRILNYHGIRKPVWVTEVGWQSGGWKSGPGVVDSEETKAAHLAEMYQRLRPLAEVVCWYVAREAGQMYGLVRPEDHGLTLNPAYHTYREIARTPERRGWELSGPGRVEAGAGETTRHRWEATNRTDERLTLKASLFEPVEWARGTVTPETVPPGDTTTIEVTLAPPSYAVPGEIPCALVAWSPDGPAEAAAFTLDLTNEGDSYAVAIERRWAIRVDEEGEKVGNWMPLAQLVTPPGGRMNQEVRIYNRGSANETFRLTLDGPAADWTTGFPRDVTIKGGGEHWVGIIVTVPEGTERGTCPLILTVTSTTHPEVSDTMAYPIPVGP